MSDMDLINKIMKSLSDGDLEKFIETSIPPPRDKETSFFMRGYIKGATTTRDKIINIIKEHGKYS